MIITRAPFRISFAGGGSDIAAYYRKRAGAVLSATIDKYIYISIHPYFNRSQSLLKYSNNELVNDVDSIAHPIIREAIKMLWPQGGVEIVSTADVPGGTGLGSSSSFTTALMHALYAYRGTFASKEKLAQKACEMEIERLGEPIGKQDQYAAAYGGLNFIEFMPNDTVNVSPVMLSAETMHHLEKCLMLFYLGGQRDTREILQDQNHQVSVDDQKLDNLSKMVELAFVMREQLHAGDLRSFGQALHQGWELKRTLSAKISDPRIDGFYSKAMAAGALGGKLAGAGGGGFLMLYVPPENQDAVRQALAELYELPFSLDHGGSKVIYVGERTVRQGFCTD